MELITSPLGSVGLTAKLYGGVPPAPVTGVKATAAVPAVSALVAIAGAAARGPLTVRLKVLLLVAPTLSVTVTVYVVRESAAACVPEIAPEDGSKTRFAGSDGVMPNAYGVVPPAAVTGLKRLTAVPALRVRLATAWVVVRALLTRMLRSCVTCAPTLSAPVIV